MDIAGLVSPPSQRSRQLAVPMPSISTYSSVLHIFLITGSDLKENILNALRNLGAVGILLELRHQVSLSMIPFWM